MKKKIFCNSFLIFLFTITSGLFAREIQRKGKPISVNYEWDKLEEVILGSPKKLTVPGNCPTIKFGFDYQSGNEEWIKKHGGQEMSEIDPDFYKKLVQQSDNLAKILESHNIKVHRHNPDLLTPEELVFMSDLEKGHNFLYPRDPVIVIGNHVIETALKLPMRTKEKFIIRKIFNRIRMNHQNFKYVSVPSVSPSFPVKGGIYLEGGDVMLNGYEIYVGHSGNASNKAGIEWLRNYLGKDYTVRQIEIKDFQHLDCVLSLIRPGLAVRCPDAFVGSLPDSLKNWDFINIPLEDAKKLACNVFVIDQNTVIIDERFTYLKEELEKRGIKVISIPFDAIAQMGGGFRCSHHPVRRIKKK
ncbi:MAG: hypothetical protein K9L78_05165 [Victivallales bacterium]|nr:hypothetical protein [Victivallales bacterium]MCF7889493.1 hypothetical protein [Victivallales bacterium]